ncbi:hypothetical protein H2199_006357 [Coniosporium tulheliwenetii]|uniref:Uncharacterized protein n=1 Tax=Coniosporium tulheliwenetii TaxID=3383036 RepID=A0ACC2YVW3_9PEZI|nr:hypothetical protein H2199_006357 [Cladosporium sp. JES 115]
MLGDCPHDWLFERVSCVIHHGGAGTTAAGIAAGKPTIVVPFFGDQPFWGEMIAQAGAGPHPIPFRHLGAYNLAAAIKSALAPEVSKKHKRWDVGSAKSKDTWQAKRGSINFSKLQPMRTCEMNLDHGPWEPVSGGGLAIADLFYDVFKGIGEMGSGFTGSPGRPYTRPAPRSTEACGGTAESSTSYTQVPLPSVKDAVLGFGPIKGTGRMTKAIVRAPMAFTVALAQGSHNAPRLWRDTTVRPTDKITGLGSGLKAAGKGFVLGTYDGISGLVMQPVIGGREDGVLGAAKGFAKGIIGLPVKLLAGK